MTTKQSIDILSIVFLSTKIIPILHHWCYIAWRFGFAIFRESLLRPSARDRINFSLMSRVHGVNKYGKNVACYQFQQLLSNWLITS